jgi:hypothetical protein
MLEEQMMNNLNFPEDSILKRHFDATVEMKRQIWLQNPPTDSILHRHAMGISNHPAVWASTEVKSHSATRSVNIQASSVSASSAAEEKKGFLSRLFDIFRSA